MSSVSAKDIARLMLDKLEKSGELIQEDIAFDLHQKYENEFVHENESGNLAINSDVLKAFRDLTSTTVVWDRRGRLWRKRNSFDSSSRQQD